MTKCHIKTRTGCNVHLAKAEYASYVHINFVETKCGHVYKGYTYVDGPVTCHTCLGG